MSSIINYNCLPLVTTPVGSTGATGDPGATGATGSPGFVVVFYTGSTVTTLTTTWETLATYTVNASSATGQLLQDGEGYMIQASLTTGNQTTNSRRFRINIGSTSIGTIYGAFFPIANNDTADVTINIIRRSSTQVAVSILSGSKNSAFCVVGYQTATVSDMASNSFVVSIEGYNPTADPTETVTHNFSVVNFMNKA